MGKSTRFAIEPNQASDSRGVILDEQSKQFIEAARELGCDDSEERFVETVRKIAKAPPQHKPKQRKGAPRRSG